MLEGPKALAAKKHILGTTIIHQSQSIFFKKMNVLSILSDFENVTSHQVAGTSKSIVIDDKMKIKKRKKEKTILGWREWVTLPTLSRFPIKAKIDTGAKTSALHAHDIEIFKSKNKTWVSFEIVPSIKMKHPILVKALLVAHRNVKSSMGETTKRPVIQTLIRVGSEEFPIELTLVNRSLMGFRMLIGRRALKKRFLINPSRSFLLDKQKKKG